MKANTDRSLAARGTPTPPHKQEVAVGAQLDLLLNDARFAVEQKAPVLRIADIYEQIREAVKAEGGALAFAVAMGTDDEPDVSRRLRRVDNTKGQTQRAFLDFLGFLGIAGRDRFLRGLCAVWGYKPPEPIAGLSDRDKLAIVVAGISSEGLRAMEKLRGLPVGSLTP